MSDIELESVEDIKQSLEAQQEPAADDINVVEQDAKVNLSYHQRLETAYNNLNDLDKQAWLQGWRPQEFDKGKRKDGTDRPHLSAEEFLKKSEDYAPIAKDRMKEMSKKIEESEKIAKEALKAVKQAKEDGYKKALEDIKIKQREAVQLGDEETWENLEKQRDRYLENAFQTNEPQKKEEPIVDDSKVSDVPKPHNFSESEQEIIRNFYAQNTWMTTDPKLAAYATQSEMELAKEKPYLSMQERLEVVQQEVREVFSSKFNSPSTSTKNIFSSGSNSGFGNNPKSKGYAEMSAADKKNCDTLIRIRGINEKGENAVKAFKLNYAKSVTT